MHGKTADDVAETDDVLESSTAELLTGPIDAAWARAVLAFQKRLITSILRPHLLVAASEPEPEPVADPTVPPELVPLLRASGELGMARYRYVTWSISRQCWSMKLPRTVDPRPRMRGEYATQEDAASGGPGGTGRRGAREDTCVADARMAADTCGRDWQGPQEKLG
jgi:hypothetical protein